MPKISRMFSFTGATMKYQVRPTSVIFYEKKKKYVCNRSRMIVKILEVWIASKIRLRPGRDDCRYECTSFWLFFVGNED